MNYEIVAQVVYKKCKEDVQVGILEKKDLFKEISSDIKSFWKSGGLMTNPMTSYFESALSPNAHKGHVDIT